MEIIALTWFGLALLAFRYMAPAEADYYRRLEKSGVRLVRFDGATVGPWTIALSLRMIRLALRGPVPQNVEPARLLYRRRLALLFATVMLGWLPGAVIDVVLHAR